MQSVTVDKQKLLSVIKENREKHVAEFESASRIFVQDAIKKLAEMLEQAKTKGRIIQSLGLVEPQSYAADYDTAIKMLEMSTASVIELTYQEFVQYVEDQWSWKRSFSMTTSMYNNKAGK